jgi:hypothetical protein
MTYGPGQSIAVARDPPSVAIYSIQDGRRIHVLPIAQEGRTLQLSGLWWFTESENSEENSNIPDIFKRNGVIVSTFELCMVFSLRELCQTGSAHSILKILPLLDHLQDENDDSLTFVFSPVVDICHRISDALWHPGQLTFLHSKDPIIAPIDSLVSQTLSKNGLPWLRTPSLPRSAPQHIASRLWKRPSSMRWIR